MMTEEGSHMLEIEGRIKMTMMLGNRRSLYDAAVEEGLAETKGLADRRGDNPQRRKEQQWHRWLKVRLLIQFSYRLLLSLPATG